MWLLSTDHAKLHFFTSPEAVTGSYVILSHTWGKKEQTFQDTQALQDRCKITGENPRDLSTPKTSSSELSKAINSMFHWYSCVEVCYAHMEGVESDCDLKAPNSAFRNAQWHMRGWTLQELIAPFTVIFVSEDWKIIGTKLELADLLAEITGVWSRILVHEMRVSDVSVGERMSWASRRKTTHVKDEACSLMGLFNITIPTIYREGRRAFQHLQHKIMKQLFDTTLFTWDDWVGDGTFVQAEGLRNHQSLKRKLIPMLPTSSLPHPPYLDWQWEGIKPKGAPVLQRESNNPRRQFGPFGRVELPAFSATSYRMQCRFPVIESDGFTIVVLLCKTSREHLGLLLHSSKDRVQDSYRKKYCTGHGWKTFYGEPIILRLVSLGADFYNLRLFGKPVMAEWRDIVIADSPPHIKRDITLNPSYHLHGISASRPVPFRLPHWLIGRMSSMGMELGMLHLESKPVDGKPLKAAAIFRDLELTGESIVLMLGTCVQSSGPQTPQYWAKAMPLSLTDSSTQRIDDFSHDCLEHHIDSWLHFTKEFGDANQTVKLSFSRCRMNPKSTLVIHIELEGLSTITPTSLLDTLDWLQRLTVYGPAGSIGARATSSFAPTQLYLHPPPSPLPRLLLGASALRYGLILWPLWSAALEGFTSRLYY
ncbi:hypothetical protein GSI_05623 [Ganoderma sinense ZZ0214-1]|uniref:Heterokaryon incompatibility domain-containing protein n=1 Tax=Ganoderma sinense ZZ0214-1 TaxID=1077348 RepID=A0A2G8SFA1_9APHY|nr:hypothetical protein GSI_05623 [Ganoderma sinense ZZ0214-1]